MRALGQPALSRPAEGLYDPRFEHDACGVAFVATLTGVPSRTIVDQALTALRNLDHRGATGADANDGDGAGITVQRFTIEASAGVTADLVGATGTSVRTLAVP